MASGTNREDKGPAELEASKGILNRFWIYLIKLGLSQMLGGSQKIINICRFREYIQFGCLGRRNLNRRKKLRTKSESKKK